MQYSPLGRTGLQVSRICLGTMTWGEQNTQSEAFEQMDYAVGQGVNFFDTAELYAVPPKAETQGKTEEIIGNWFESRGGRDKIILATKITGPGIGWIRGGNAPINRQTMRDAVDQSLKRLKTDYIDLYQLHWPNRGSYHFGQQWSFPREKHDNHKIESNFIEVLETAKDLIALGKIRHIGLSNETSWGTMNYLRLAEKHGLPRMASIQNEYSLTCRIFEPDLAEIAVQEDVGLLAWSPLAAGALSGKYLNGKLPPGSRRTLGSRHQHRVNETTDRAIESYVRIALKHDLDPCQMAIAFVLSRRFTTAAIIGATTMDQLKTDIASHAITLSDDMLRDIESVRRAYPMPY